MRRTPMPRGKGFQKKPRQGVQPAREEAIDENPSPPYVAILHAEPRVYEALMGPSDIELDPGTPLLRGELGYLDGGYRFVPPRRGTYGSSTAFVPAPKDPRGENRLLLDMAKGEPCLLQTRICNHNPETTVACHPRGVAGEGTGGHYKASDERVIYGCSDCNHFTDAYGGATAEEKAAAFIMARPRQIARWKEIAATDRKEPRRRAALWALERLGED